MSTFLYALGRWAYRSWKIVVAGWFAATIALAVLALTLFTRLSTAINVPGTEAQKGIDFLSQTFPQISGGQGLVLAVARPGHKVTDPDVKRAIDRLVPKLYKIPDTLLVLIPGENHLMGHSLTIGGAINADRTAGIIQVQMKVPTTEVSVGVQNQLTELAKQSSDDVVEFHAGGTIYSPPQPSIKPTEVIGAVVALLVLAITFGSLVAAGIPMIGAMVGAAFTIGSAMALTHFLDVSPSTPLFAIMIGVAVGIDYALFLVSRHRQQLADGYAPEESAGLALATAGSAVAFAGLTVVIALLGVAVANIPVLTIIGCCGALAVTFSVLITMTLMPALMGILGARLIPKTRLTKRGPDKGQPKPSRHGRGGARYVALVTKHPLITLLVVIPPLLLLAVPALNLKTALPDGSEVDNSLPQKQTFSLVKEKFGPGWNAPIIVTADIITSLDPLKLVASIKADLEKIPGVAMVAVATPNAPNADTMIVQLYPQGAANDARTIALVKHLRSMRGTFKAKYDSAKRSDGCRGGCDFVVTGYTAAAIDVSTNLARALLPFALLVMGMSLVLLTMVMRSVFVPVKATLGYLLSVGGAFGGVQLLYERGLLQHQLHTAHVGPIISFGPILIMATMFGLAMDYEVFLVSRMREDYVHHGSAEGAIRRGFTSSARVVTAAACIMVTVFVAFVPESDANVQPIAAGLAIGVFIDAFIVRMTLVPAAMTLAGHMAWYIPSWLDRLLPIFDVEGEGIYHQLALRDFPYPDAPDGFYGENLAAEARGRVHFSGINLGVEPGGLMLVDGASASTRSGLALMLAGRLRPSSGKLKVAGLVLPQQSPAARSRLACVQVAEESDVVRALHRSIRRRTRGVIVDGLELVVSEGDRQYVLDLIDRLCVEQNIPCVITTSTESLDYLNVPRHVQRLRLPDADLLPDPVAAGKHAADDGGSFQASDIRPRILEETR